MLEPREVVRMTELCHQSGMSFLEQAKFLISQNCDVRRDPRFLEIAEFFTEERPGATISLQTARANAVALAKKRLETSCFAVAEGGPELNIFAELKRALMQGDYAEKFPVGMILPDVWVDRKNGRIYYAPLRIVDYRQRERSDGTMAIAATLLRAYTHPIKVQFDAAEKTGAPDTRDRYGWSRWNYAGLRQYLNSDGRPGEWGLPTHEYDSLLDIAATEYGYLAGCSAELLQAIDPVAIATDTIEGGVNLTQDQFFLPTVENLHWDVSGDLDSEQETWQYFRNTTSDLYVSCEKRVFRNETGEPEICLTRSAYRGVAYYVWAARSDGSAGTYIAYGAYACAPACLIFADDNTAEQGQEC